MKDIPGYEGKYAVDEDGNVYSFVKRQSKILKPRTKKDGRHYVFLGRNNEYQICHLVLLAFVGSRPQNTVACHNNGIQTDNRIINLRWDTQSANHRDAVKHGTHPGFSNARLTMEDIKNIREMRARGAFQHEIADVFGISQTQVSRILRGLRQVRFQEVN